MKDINLSRSIRWKTQNHQIPTVFNENLTFSKIFKFSNFPNFEIFQNFSFFGKFYIVVRRSMLYLFYICVHLFNDFHLFHLSRLSEHALGVRAKEGAKRAEDMAMPTPPSTEFGGRL